MDTFGPSEKNAELQALAVLIQEYFMDQNCYHQQFWWHFLELPYMASIPKCVISYKWTHWCPRKKDRNVYWISQVASHIVSHIIYLLLEIYLSIAQATSQCLGLQVTVHRNHLYSLNIYYPIFLNLYLFLPILYIT